VVGFAFFISSTAMTVTSLIENRKLLNPESETIVWLMVFEDLVLIVFILIFGSGGENPLLLIAKIFMGFFLFYLIARYGKEQIKSILKRDDELPVLLTFSAVLAIAYASVALGIPESLMVIAFGVTLGATDPEAFEAHARPFKDVFLVVFFVFFGVSVDFSGGTALLPIVLISLLAILSKFLSGVLTGIVIHKNVYSGIEIWANIIGRGEFSIAIAALYGSGLVSGTIAAIVIITSIVGSFVARYSTRINTTLRSSGIFRKTPADIT
jgi:monovalent cation:H+ antiporter-2, CPA2 family